MKYFSRYDLDGICICSVVPALNKIFKNVCRDLFARSPLFAVPKNIGISLQKYNPKQIGADRLVAAKAAHAKYKSTAIVIDAGSAITIDLVTKNGAFAGGVIVPGMELSARALVDMTAKLPLVKKIRPRRVVGQCTGEAIASGIYYGTAGLIDAIVRRISRETKTMPVVVATGGSAKMIAKISETIDHVEPDLLLQGLRLVWERNESGVR